MNKKNDNSLNKKIDKYADILFIFTMLLFTIMGLYVCFQLRILAFFLMLLFPIFCLFGLYSIIVLLPLCIVEEIRKEK